MTFLESEAPELEVDSWVNSDPVSIDSGTFLLDFWSYSCRGCLKGIEMMRRLHEEYPELTVVGIHAPEFDFENELENVRKAVQRLGINYPVALDAEKQARDSYSNNYWPSSVLVHDGEIVWQDINSSFVELQEKLVELLDIEDTVDGLSADSGAGKEASPETYLGFRRCRGVNEEGNFRGEKTFSAPGTRKLERVYLDGTWSQEEEYLEAGEDAKLFYHFRGSEVYIVAHPGEGIRDIEVRIDGEDVDHSEAGEDLDIEENSFLRVKNPGLFSVVDKMHSRSELVLEPEKGTRIYSLEFD